jgi:cyclopropane-fatty-acyl-phospholipid synthase
MTTIHAPSVPGIYSSTSWSSKTPPAERLLVGMLRQLSEGQLRVRTEATEYIFGAAGSSPAATIRVMHPGFFSRMLRTSPSLALGESYMDGWWRVDQGSLADFLGILLKNKLDEHLGDRWFTRPLLWLQRVLHTPYSLLLAKRCIAHHYNLGNEFFRLFLDPSLTYSCGYQLSPTDTLAQMQEQKYALICKKLGLKAGQVLLDIGCGWGGMLVHAAKRHGIRGLGITLSSSQAELANARIKAEKLENTLAIDLRDYRKTSGTFDALVSIGMFEHVGKACYPAFMRQLRRLLKPGGLGLLHTIGVTDPPSYRPDPWTVKHIFPGSRLPRLDEIVSEMHKNDLIVGHIENLKLHYAETLRHWHANFQRNRSAIQALGEQYSDRFMRMWEYYLQSCEASFRHSSVQLYQVLFCKGSEWTLPMCFNFTDLR